ncbi:efflux RND transporter periplasmic adaptor subunit [Candidatus Babeliales bacterium]|nr:efflux RND transporter periplasmic adaptor subunit [Candidatus Babeliales bacterium]
MKMKKIITFLSFFLILSLCIYWFYKKFFVPQKKLPYKIEFPKKRTIYQTVYATGILEIKDHIKIGSLTSGIIKKIFIKENDIVKKGQLLALINNGKEDTQIQKSEGELEKIKAEMEYQENYFKRQKELFKSNQISKDFFEQITRNYKQTKSDLKIKQANLKFNQIEYENTKIKAPTDGVIVLVGITIGQRITTDLDATVLFVIAKDINKMEAKLDIDESDIGQITVGQKVKFTVGTYLDKTFKGTIRKISHNPQFKGPILSYKAYININNENMLLRPGMTANAKIKVAKCIDCLSISSQAFQINPQILKMISKKLKYEFCPIEKKRKKSIEKNSKESYPIKYVWTLKNNNFIEKAIKVDTTDENYFEVKNGLKPKNMILIDIQEDNKEKSFYKKMFKSIF